MLCPYLTMHDSGVASVTVGSEQEKRLKRDSYLTDLRKRARLTQKQLGEKLGLATSYGQKKISQWESDLARPDSEEIEKLAKVLKVPRDQLAGYFTDRSAQSLVDLFTRLSVSERPALFAVCYSGRPRILADPFIRAKYEQALKRNLFVAMFVPFPLLPGSGKSASNLLLAAYYTRVWGSVFASIERLRGEINGKELDKHLAVYGLKQPTKSEVVMIPPFVSRYSLLLEKNEMGDFDKSLYLAVETADRKELQLIGSHKDESATEQIQDWEAYFAGVVSTWIKTTTLPKHDSGYWQYVAEPTRQNED
jgi:transcriptional regulator with XRE-family HTH domain